MERGRKHKHTRARGRRGPKGATHWNPESPWQDSGAPAPPKEEKSSGLVYLSAKSGKRPHSLCPLHLPFCNIWERKNSANPTSPPWVTVSNLSKLLVPLLVGGWKDQTEESAPSAGPVATLLKNAGRRGDGGCRRCSRKAPGAGSESLVSESRVPSAALGVQLSLSDAAAEDKETGVAARSLRLG